MKYEIEKGEYETWHSLHLTRDEASRIFLSNHEANSCWKRSGARWRRAEVDSYTILRPEVDQWLREAVGHRYSEVWDVDRYYYPGEELPDLMVSRKQWFEQFVCHHSPGGWDAFRCADRKYWAFVGFHEGHIIGPHTPERLPAIFALMFL